MNNKKKFVGILLFLLIAFGIFTFADPLGDRTQLEGTGEGEQTEKEPGEEEVKDPETQPSEEEGEEQDVLQTQPIEEETTPGNNQTPGTGTPGTDTPGEGIGNADLSGEEATQAVIAAENALTSASKNYAQNLVDSLTDKELQDELNERLEAVQEKIDLALSNLNDAIEKAKEVVAILVSNDTDLQDAKNTLETDITEGNSMLSDKNASQMDLDAKAEELLALVEDTNQLIKEKEEDATEAVEALEKEVYEATSMNNISNARNTYSSVETLVNNLLAGDVKDDLLARLEALNIILSDTKAPQVSGVSEGDVKQSVTVNATDDTEVTALLDGEEYVLGTEITAEGVHTLVVRDEAFNVTTVTFTVDHTNPELVPEYWTLTLEADKTATFTDDMLPEVSAEDNLDENPVVEYLGNNVDLGTPGSYKIQYVTTDAAGNKAYNDIFVTVVDTTAPEFDLSKIASTFKVGKDIYTYPQPGKVTDNVDGEISFGEVHMNWYHMNEDGTKGERTECFGWNNWNTSLESCSLGDYIITYEVSDSHGNKAYAEKQMTLVESQTPQVARLYILNVDDEYRTSISSGEKLLLEATFDEELSVMPKATIGNKTFDFAKYTLNEDGTHRYSLTITVDDTFGLTEGQNIPFTVYHVVDMVGNEAETFTNEDVTVYKDNNGNIIYDQVKYENPFVSASFHNSSKDALNVNEAWEGDLVRIFVHFNQDLDLNNLPKIVIGGVETRLNLSNVYADGSKDYGVDVRLTSEMNLEVGQEIPFVVTNIVLANGNHLPNLTQENITNITYSGVIYNGVKSDTAQA